MFGASYPLVFVKSDNGGMKTVVLVPVAVDIGEFRSTVLVRVLVLTDCVAGDEGKAGPCREQDVQWC